MRIEWVLMKVRIRNQFAEKKEGCPGSLLSRFSHSMALPNFLDFILYIDSRKQ